MIAHLRQNYTRGGLRETEVGTNPFDLFHIWLKEAIDAEMIEPNAMTLATITPDGKPSARMVLLKDLDENGFVFFTNYQSNKGQHLAENAQAALVFWWDQLERQVRVEGIVEKLTEEESDVYFQSRPRNSQLGAWVSEQSQVIASREVLEERLKDFEQKYPENEQIPRPSHWGGFRVIPHTMEFWQGRPSRLHDRLVYSLKKDNTWDLSRLAP